VTLLQHGIQKIFEGVTTYRQVRAVAVKWRIESDFLAPVGPTVNVSHPGWLSFWGVPVVSLQPSANHHLYYGVTSGAFEGRAISDRKGARARIGTDSRPKFVGTLREKRPSHAQPCFKQDLINQAVKLW